MASITPQEHYEVIRIILESKTEKITICKHNSTNKYITVLLDKLNITLIDCQKEQQERQQFDPHMGYKPSH
jgi:hypothetical protein